MRPILLAGVLLAGCASGGGGSGPVAGIPAGAKLLFDCREKGRVVQLAQTADGSLVYASNKPNAEGEPDVVSMWSGIREGFVVGGGGGQQSHIRLIDGPRSIVLFEGGQGQYMSRPGETYAGAATVTPDNPDSDYTIRCASSDMNEKIVDSVTAWTKEIGVPPPVPEEAESNFDGWF